MTTQEIEAELAILAYAVANDPTNSLKGYLAQTLTCMNHMLQLIHDMELHYHVEIPEHTRNKTTKPRFEWSDSLY